MGFVMPNKMVVVGGAVLGVALILQIVGLATPGWLVVPAPELPSVDAVKGVLNQASGGSLIGDAVKGVLNKASGGSLIGDTLGRLRAGREGLWKRCSSRGSCTELTESTEALEAVRAFGIMGVLAMAASMGCVLLTCLKNEEKIFSLLAPVCAAVAAFCVLIKFAVFAEERSDVSEFFNYSFGFTVIACMFSLAAAILFFLGRNRPS